MLFFDGQANSMLTAGHVSFLQHATPLPIKVVTCSLVQHNCWH